MCVCVYVCVCVHACTQACKHWDFKRGIIFHFNLIIQIIKIWTEKVLDISNESWVQNDGGNYLLKKLCFFQCLFSDSKIIVKGTDLLIPLKLLLPLNQVHWHDWSTFLPDDDSDGGAF